jgi:hypothetical protein
VFAARTQSLATSWNLGPQLQVTKSSSTIFVLVILYFLKGKFGSVQLKLAILLLLEKSGLLPFWSEARDILECVCGVTKSNI